MVEIRTAWDRPARPPDRVTEHTLLIGLTPPAGLARLPANLCLLLDCSDSMKGQNLEDARAACRLAVQCLNPEDRLSLVTFHARPQARFIAQPPEALTEAVLEDHLAGIQAGNTTRTDRALATAERVLATHRGPGRVSLALLITDGHPTDAQGKPLTEYGSLYEMAERLATAGISLVTVGLGSAHNYNSAFLTTLADRGRGRFCYAPEAGQLGALLRDQIRTAQATVIAGLEIALTPRMAGTHLTGFCRIAPQYLPFDLPFPGPDGTWRLSCGTLELEAAGTEIRFLARVEAHGRFGISSGSHPLLAVSASWQPATGPRASTREIVASLHYTPIEREQQRVNEEAQLLRLRWEMNLYQDRLGRATGLRRTGELLGQIAAGAAGLGLTEAADQALAQLDHLRRTGQLDPDRLTRAGQLLRATRHLGTPEDGVGPGHLGTGFGGGEESLAPAPSPPVPGLAPRLSMDLTMIEVMMGRAPGARLPLNRMRLLLGRSESPDWTVDLDLTAQELGPTPAVSRRHAELSWEEGRLWLRDLGSTNGTFVNGRRLALPGQGQPGEPCELRAGDVVRVANVELKVVTQ